MQINTIGVCGAGTMGRGIALTAALAGFNTLLFDLQPEALEKARVQLTKELNKSIEKKKITEAIAAQALSRIDFTSEIEHCLAEIFIEAIVEQIEPKVALFNQLAELNHGDCIFASNTSSLSVTQMAKAIQHPERVIGLHFFNPAHLMKLVEVVTTTYTATAVQQTAWQLMLDLKKTPVLCIDSPGFIVNRVARPYYIESLRLIEEQKATMEQIDRILTSAGFKMGPFALMDLIGNDINYAVSCSVYDQLGKPERLKPSFVQQQLVQTGKWGQKSGEGYYQYKNA
jgi:3-hydroxybutyryl-CoA dehydrogenase